MKRVWLSKKFSYIYEARPSTNFLLYAVIIYTYGWRAEVAQRACCGGKRKRYKSSACFDQNLQRCRMLVFTLHMRIGRLLNNTKIEDFLNMDLGTEVDLAVLKKMSTEYTDAKKLAIKEANEVVDVQNMQHISDDEELIGVVVENISENWNASRHLFYEQTGQMALEVRRQPVPHEDQEYGGFDVELELLLSQT
ncbi:uncharacterized protein LOC120015195 isoform X2 [Tripterygium wilfordii]|nr:uncharacterized protein LOC120015195 isoform X2 [Tripterygium wilfordii]XP_038723410.1 uncharacterized protein LOC120015195 isoform X2 [Tripterygium wilfordii]